MLSSVFGQGLLGLACLLFATVRMSWALLASPFYRSGGDLPLATGLCSAGLGVEPRSGFCIILTQS